MTIWNDRYSSDEYAFGKEPNEYFKSVIDTLKPGRILVPGAGEGRDAVYAARLGWEVFAFDLSVVGRMKALKLAAEFNVNIEYQIMDAAGFDFDSNKYDLVAMTFFHLPELVRNYFFGNIYRCLNPGGMIVLEAFNPIQINYGSGGPRDPSMLLTSELLSDEMKNIDVLESSEIIVPLEEGAFHNGDAAVVRFLGIIDENF